MFFKDSDRSKLLELDLANKKINEKLSDFDQKLKEIHKLIYGISMIANSLNASGLSQNTAELKKALDEHVPNLRESLKMQQQLKEQPRQKRKYTKRKERKNAKKTTRSDNNIDSNSSDN